MINIAKSKYETNIKPNLDKITEWASNGLNDIQIASNLKISVSTLYNYQNEHLEFLEALKKGREIVDNKVENALLKRALGYEAIEEVSEVKIVNGNENKLIKRNKKHIPADVGACIFWLKNRQKAKWKDNPQDDFDNSINIDIKGV
ncbi:MAG: transposase [Fusobacterium gastrosuis]|uniref:transposase n=1 Tax=Fusobacterium gastrosuis TaxID=1755100 RepID=UPI002A8448D6|nr:transposase [Fusobacterium gastrosuis]